VPHISLLRCGILGSPNEVKKLPRHHNFDASPLFRKVLQVSCHEILRVGRKCTFQKDVIVRINAGPYANRRPNSIASIPNRTKRIRDLALGPAQPRPSHYFLILRIDFAADAKLRLAIEDGPQKYLRRRPGWIEQSRNQDVCVQNDPNHPATD